MDKEKSTVDKEEKKEIENTSKSGIEHTSFKEYVACMKEGQNEIDYTTGESIAAVSLWPVLEGLRKREALFMVDPIDLPGVQLLRKFEVKKLKRTTKVGMEFENKDEKSELDRLPFRFLGKLHVHVA